MKKFIKVFEIEILYILYGLFVFLEVGMFFLTLACVSQCQDVTGFWGNVGRVLFATVFISILEMEKLSLKNRIKEAQERKAIAENARM